MVNQQLLDFIKGQTLKGITKEKTTNDLLANGWTTKDIEEAFTATTPSSSFTVPKSIIPKTTISQAGNSFIPPSYYNNNVKLYPASDQGGGSSVVKIIFTIFVLFLLAGGGVFVYYFKDDLMSLNITKNVVMCGKIILNNQPPIVENNLNPSPVNITPDQTLTTPPAVVVQNTVPATPDPKTVAAMQEIQQLIQSSSSAYLILNTIPTSHILSPIIATDSSNFSYLGLTLSVPWVNVTKKIVTGNPITALQITFSNGKSIALTKADTMSTDQLSKWNSLVPSIKTDYDFENAMWSATPGQVANETPEDKATATAALLIAKQTILTTTPIYSFDTGIVKGFQYGDPTPKGQVSIDLFDTNGTKYNLSISGTQDEIDYILSSIKNSQ